VIDFSPVVQASDFDDDTITLDADSLRVTVIDDIPTIGPIVNGLVDFNTAAPPPGDTDDFGGSSTPTTGAITLNGSIGADENSGDTSSDGTKTYTFASASLDDSVVSGLKKEIIEDSTRVVYFTDGVGGTDDVFDVAFDTLFYDIVLDQDDFSGAGSYTFTVYQDPPPASLEFDFSGLPSNQSLFGMIPGKLDDPTGKALLIMPKEVVLDPDGTYSNTSKTINTSKGGGEVTIGIGDQMFDGYGKTDKDADGDGGGYFVFVTDPDQDILAGISEGLSNVYDDADNIGFGGTFDSMGAEFTVVQNSTSMVARVTAYDIDPAGRVGETGVDAGVNTDARDFITDPLLTDDQVNINEVMVFAADGTTLLEHVVRVGGTAVRQDINAPGAGDDDDPTVSISFVDTADGAPVIYSADIAVNVHDSGYTFAYIADAPHDAVLISAVNDPEESTGNKFDIGGFAISEAQPTPDQQFDFTVDITDFDGDVVTSDPFSVSIDGTGIFDDDDFNLSPS
jgi:hypothetical protein